MNEKGISFVRFGWLGICAGAGTPQPVIGILNRHVAEAVKAPDYRQLIEKAGSVALSSSPQELAKILAETYEQTALTVREFGLAQD
jgi:tripartite-type tricarboxylate transporter receptor subunit TctC